MNAKVLLLCLAVLAGCSSPPPQGDPVLPTEYISLVRGNTLVGGGPIGFSFRIYVADDLSRRGIVTIGDQQIAITGRVAATDRGVCSSSPEVRNGETRCYVILRDGETFQAIYEGAVDTVYRIEPGNPYSL